MRCLLKLDPGTYHLRELSNGIIYAHSSATECRDHSMALEVDGFPVPFSLRITGFDRSLSAFGIERGRLPHMYKVGSDTSATMLLLLHGASRLSLDGYGAHVLPSWVNEEQRHNLLHDLSKLAEAAETRAPLSAAQDAALAN